MIQSILRSIPEHPIAVAIRQLHATCRPPWWNYNVEYDTLITTPALFPWSLLTRYNVNELPGFDTPEYASIERDAIVYLDYYNALPSWNEMQIAGSLLTTMTATVPGVDMHLQALTLIWGRPMTEAHLVLLVMEMGLTAETSGFKKH